MSLQAVQALGDDCTKCITQIYKSLALITKGSLRTLSPLTGRIQRRRGMASQT